MGVTVSDHAAWARTFSLPADLPDPRLLGTITAMSARGVLTELLSRHGDDLRGRSDGLVELLGSCGDGALTFDQTWHSAFGQAETALITGQDVLGAAVRVALTLTESGHGGDWWASTEPSVFCFGPAVLDDVRRVEVRASGDTATVHVQRRGAEVVCSGRDGTWTLPRTVSSLPTVGRVRFLTGLAAPPEEFGEPAFPGIRPMPSLDTRIVDHFRRAFDLLDELGYLPWVELVLREILVSAKDPQTRIMSGSSPTLPGMIHITSPASLLDTADTLVHESAHQYFNLLNRVGDVDDGSDRDLYWSPPVRTERPLSKILIAYHAFANVELFYRAVIEAGRDPDGSVARCLPDVADMVDQLDGPLRENPALTALGRALYEPLATRRTDAAGGGPAVRESVGIARSPRGRS